MYLPSTAVANDVTFEKLPRPITVLAATLTSCTVNGTIRKDDT